MLKRSFYLHKLIQERDNRALKLIRGIKGSGKSTLLSLLYEELRKEEVSVGVGLFASSCLDSARTFLESQKGGAVLLIDDIDRLDDAVIAEFMGKASLYGTCSSSLCFSAMGESKVICFPLYPLSYSEYCCLYRDGLYMKDTLAEYENARAMMPAKYNIGSSFSDFYFYMDMLQSLKNQLKKVYGIDRLDSDKTMKLLADNIGRILSVDDIAFKSRLQKKTIEAVINVLKDANLLVQINGYDERTDELIEGGAKFYFTDNYFIKTLRRGKALPLIKENIAAIELLRRYDGVYYGVESDFIIFDDGEKKIYQILSEDDDFSSRLDTLMAIDCSHRCLIAENISCSVSEGMEIMDMKTFLLKRK